MPAAAVGQNRTNVLTQPVLKVVAVAFFEAELVIVDDDQTFHGNIISVTPCYNSP